MGWPEFLFFMSCPENEKPIRSFLQRPDKLNLPLDVDLLEQIVIRARRLLLPSLNSLFERALLAHILIHNNIPGLVDWAKKYFVLEKILPGLTWQAIEQGKWGRVLIPVTGSDGARIICLIAGVTDVSFSLICPDWAREIFSLKSINTLEQTIDMILTRTGSDKSVYIFPLLEHGARIEGGSFALGLALGLLSLIKGEQIYQNFVATGNLRLCDGAIYVDDVGGREEKYKIVKHYNFSLFLVPYANTWLAMQQKDQLSEVVCVRDLDQAWIWVKLYDETNADELKRTELLTTPAGFVDNCLGVKCETLRWFLTQRLNQDLVDEIVADEKISSAFVRNIGICIAKERDRAELLLNLDVNPDKLASTSKSSAFLWCVYKFKLATHKGLLTEAKKWSEYAEQFLPYAKITNKKEVVSFINSRFVHERHNNYVFKPYFSSSLQRYIDQLEPSQPDMELGKLYGTIAQNYGFCGPEYLKKVECYVRLAQENFGNGQIDEPELQEQWQREFSILAYAYLDAGRIGQARAALWEYLGISAWTEFNRQQCCDTALSYQQALLVRYLADSLNDAEYGADSRNVFAEWKNEFLNCLKRIRYEKRSHPWQLWTYNLGRLLAETDEIELAKNTWQTSLELCFCGGETVVVMGLLPLAGLFKYNLYGAEEKRKLGEIFDLLQKTSSLSRKHFSELLACQKEEDVLKLVAEKPEKFFPFSYR